MPDELPYGLPYKPLSNPDNLIVPKPGDFSRRGKRARLERQKLREAQQQEQQAGDTPD